MAKADSSSTQDFVDIREIYEDVLILKTGGLRKVLLASGINVELKSEEEQNVIYFEYQNFLNSLEFSLQLIVHSRKLNVNNYLKLLEERETEEEDELLKNEVAEYREFIRSFVAENDIMAKHFFVVVPYDPVTVPSAKGLGKILPGVLAAKKTEGSGATEEAEDKAEELSKNIFQLNQRVDHTIAGLHNIGIRTVPLNNEELIELFYNLYNPEAIEKENISL